MSGLHPWAVQRPAARRRSRALSLLLLLGALSSALGAVPASGAEPVRSFDGEDDEVRVRVGPVANVTGAVSMVAVLRPRSLGDFDVFGLHTSEGSGAGYELWHDSNGQLVLWNGSNDGFGPPDPFELNEWRLVAATKASGTATPRFHAYDFEERDWTHGSGGASTIANGGSVSGGTIRFGSWQSTLEYDGDYAAAALFDVALSDEQVETLADSYEAWLALEPTGMWVFNQTNLTLPLLDETGQGADEIEEPEGTKVVTPPLGGDPDSTVFRGDFLTGDTSQWIAVQEVGDSAEVSVARSSPEPPEGESYYGRFEVRSGDTRAEVSSGLDLYEGEDVYIRFLIRWEDEFPLPGESDWGDIFWQVHQHETEASPPLALGTSGSDPGDLELADTRGTVWWEGPAIDEGRWHEFVIRVNHSQDPRVGFAELWMDGVHQRMTNEEFRYYGETLLDEYNYPKSGYYRDDDMTGTGIVYVAGYRIARSLEDLP